MKYDVIVIGAGISGLSAAALLAKRGLKVVVAEHGDVPGGSCGVFKRENAVFDQGAAMLYGFGEHGFNPHRFLFNCLEEPIEVLRHDLLYTVCFGEKRIRFWPDVDRFIGELSSAFPGQAENIAAFYRHMRKLYVRVISETPSYTTPDETNPREAARGLLRHPFAYLEFLSYMGISAGSLLRRYFSDPEILEFFSKLTSTYCYATAEEAPAVMASVMFIDNHEGGSYYPAGSTMFLPGRLEKSVEEHGGEMRYGCTVTRLLLEKGRPCGVLLENGERLFADEIIYSGTVWNLYGKLLPGGEVTEKERAWAAAQIPTYPSVVLYALADRSVIPSDTSPVEMLAANPEAIDESEVTVYIPSLDDRTLCPPDRRVVEAIGPSFRRWDRTDRAHYEEQKRAEVRRILGILERRFPGFGRGLRFCELATPLTVERYTLKNGGAVAGPKQMPGQEMLQRQHICTRWDSLFCCGESTVMGTGTPTVTVSGIAAANAVLKKRGLSPFVWEPGRRDYVRIVTPPVEKGWQRQFYPSEEARAMELAAECQFCAKPRCCEKSRLDLPGILRRTACGNFTGARNLLEKAPVPAGEDFLTSCEKRCVLSPSPEGAVKIAQIAAFLRGFRAPGAAEAGALSSVQPRLRTE